MKIYSKFTAHSLALMVAGLLTASVSVAVTSPSSVFKFNCKKTDDIFTIKATSWRDPAFGYAGWTHNSDWGSFRAVKGQVIKIKVAAAAAGIHPGITVWSRGKDDTADDKYVVDHFYLQNQDFFDIGVTDETGAQLGNIIMRHVAHGYDLDGNSIRLKAMNPIRDRVPGQVTLQFTAPQTNQYMFAVGGFNPDASVDKTLNYDLDVNVAIGQ